MKKHEQEGITAAVSFLVGGLVGAGLALLLAPRSGKAARANITDMAVKAKKNLATTAHKGKELYQDGTTALSGAIEAGKAAYTEEKERHLKSV